MKELRASTVNYALLPNEAGDKLVGLAELILVVSEPSYSVDLSGDLNKTRDLTHFRVSIGTRGLRDLAKQLNGYADDISKLEARFSPQPDKPDAES